MTRIYLFEKRADSKDEKTYDNHFINSFFDLKTLLYLFDQTFLIIAYIFLITESLLCD